MRPETTTANTSKDIVAAKRENDQRSTGFLGRLISSALFQGGYY